MDFPVRYFYIGWDVTSQVQQGMKFDRAFRLPKASPWKQRQTQIDRRGVQRLDGFIQLYPKPVVLVKLPRGMDKNLCKIRIDSPVAAFVGVG